MKPESILKETEKAVQVKVLVEATFAPVGGFTSSMTKEKSISTTCWFPKSQLDENNNPKAWIMDAKAKEIAGFYCPSNGRILHSNLYIAC